jgi:hypothetical protein
VERWFSYLTTDLLQRGVYKNVQAMEKRYPALDQALERRPQAIRVEEDTDEILTSLSRYISRISGAGH